MAVYSDKKTTIGVNGNNGQVVDRFKSPVIEGAKKGKRSLTFSEYWATTMALFWKNCTRLRRNIPVLLFQFALPAIQVILFCICIGADPFNIPVAIVNEEEPPFLSKLFLDKLDPYLVHQVSFIFVNILIRIAKSHLKPHHDRRRQMCFACGIKRNSLIFVPMNSIFDSFKTILF